MLYEYHGVKTKLYAAKNILKNISIIEQELAGGKPVILEIDSFFCPWNIYYQHVHGIHFCLVTGLDETRQFLNCADGGLYLKNNLVLPMEQFIKGMGYCITYELTPQTRNDVDWADTIQQLVLKLKSTHTFDDIRAFGNAIRSSLNLEKEIQGYDDVWYVPLFNELARVSAARRKMSISLEYWRAKYNVEELREIAEAFKLAGSKWYTVRGTLLKQISVSDRSAGFAWAAHQTQELADYEEKLADQLLCINKKAISQSSNLQMPLPPATINQDKAGEYVFLNLAPFFNNKGFGNIDDADTSDLTGTGSYFLKENFPSNTIWEIGKMKFQFPDITEQNDNISCMEQIIPVPENDYTQVLFLGCGEWGSYLEFIKIHHAQGENEIIAAGFTDWAYSPLFEEEIAWEGKCIKKDNAPGTKAYVHNQTKLRLFAKSYKLKIKKGIISIKLPYCPNIHIFAITLESTTGSKNLVFRQDAEPKKFIKTGED